MVGLLKSEDQSSFAYLYDNYSGALKGIIFKMLDDHELAKDVLQEAFIKIWNNITTYDNTKGTLFNWMLNIIRNQAIDTIRSKSFKKQSKILKAENSVNNTSNRGDANASAKFDAPWN